MNAENITYHQTIDGKYRIVFEQAASTKGVTGFKVEVNGDVLSKAQEEAAAMLKWAQEQATATAS